MRESKQVVIVLTEIVLTEIEKSNTVSRIVVVFWTNWDRIFSAWTCENEIFSEWTRLRRVIKICENTVSWTCWDRILSEWSSSRKIIRYCQKSSIFSWDKDWIHIARCLSIRKIIITFHSRTRFFLIRVIVITIHFVNTMIIMILYVKAMIITILYVKTKFLSIRAIVIFLENEIFLDIQISSDQSDDNRVSVDQSNKNENNHLISFLIEISSDQSDKSDNNRLNFFENVSLMTFCDISLKNSIWTVFFRVLMMKAMNSEFFFLFIMNRIENNKKIQILDDEKFLTFVESECFLFVMNRVENDKIIEIWVWISLSSQIQLETDLIICRRRSWYAREKCE